MIIIESKTLEKAYSKMLLTGFKFKIGSLSENVTKTRTYI